jgi:hypothetical protein
MSVSIVHHAMIKVLQTKTKLKSKYLNVVFNKFMVQLVEVVILIK